MLGGPNPGGFRVAYDDRDDILRLEYTGHVTLDLMLAAADAAFTTPGIGAGTHLLALHLDTGLDEIDLAALKAYQAHKAAKGYPILPTAAVIAAAALLVTLRFRVGMLPVLGGAALFGVVWTLLAG